MSDREDVFDYLSRTYGTQPDYPWKRFPAYAVFRHHETGKWFGLVMRVAKGKLGLTGEGEVDVLNVKASPDLINFLMGKNGVLPAYHMNKEHWLSVVLDGSVEVEEIQRLIDSSYELTLKR